MLWLNSFALSPCSTAVVATRHIKLNYRLTLSETGELSFFKHRVGSGKFHRGTQDC